MAPKQRDILDGVLAEHPLVRGADLLAAGMTPKGIRVALENEVIHRVGKGVLASTEALKHPLIGDAVACMTTGGIICHRTAGARHGLTDDIPSQIEVLVPHGTARTPQMQAVRLVRSRIPESFTLGIQETQALGVTVRMTDKPRTVVDLLRGPTRQHALAAVHTFLGEGGAGDDLDAMAREFGVQDELSPLVEGVLQAMSRTIAPR